MAPTSVPNKKEDRNPATASTADQNEIEPPSQKAPSEPVLGVKRRASEANFDGLNFGFDLGMNVKNIKPGTRQPNSRALQSMRLKRHKTDLPSAFNAEQ